MAQDETAKYIQMFMKTVLIADVDLDAMLNKQIWLVKLSNGLDIGMNPLCEQENV